jgi:hypothetical protein
MLFKSISLSSLTAFVNPMVALEVLRLRNAMANNLQIDVAIRMNHERAVVTAVIMISQTWCAVACCTSFESRSMELLDLLVA